MDLHTIFVIGTLAALAYPLWGPRLRRLQDERDADREAFYDAQRRRHAAEQAYADYVAYGAPARRAGTARRKDGVR